MKRIITVICMFFSIILSSCSLTELKNCTLGKFVNSEGDQIDQAFEKLIASIEQQDSAAIKSMFSENAINSVDDFDESIASLLKFYKGEMTDYHRDGPGSKRQKEGENQLEEIFASYDVTTTEGVYRMAIHICTIDTQEPDNTGVTMLFIIDAEDSDMNRTYWGAIDDKVLGITIDRGGD